MSGSAGAWPLDRDEVSSSGSDLPGLVCADLGLMLLKNWQAGQRDVTSAAMDESEPALR